MTVVATTITMSLISYTTLQIPLFSSEISIDLYLLVAVVFANIVLAFLLARRARSAKLTEPKPAPSEQIRRSLTGLLCQTRIALAALCNFPRIRG
jgi:hypothetical protein